MRPEDVGFTATDLVLGKHSGRAALGRPRQRDWAITSTSEQLQEVFDEFKGLADKKKEVYDADIAALIEKRMNVAEDQWKLVKYEVHAAGGADADGFRHAQSLRRERTQTSSGGDGPLDALFRTIEEITGVSVVVRDFRVHSVTRGKDAQGESTIEVEHDGHVFRGRGVSTDTVEAATLAFLNAVNRAELGGSAVSISESIRRGVV